MAVKNGVSLNWGGFDKALSKAGHKLGDTRRSWSPWATRLFPAR